MKATSPRRWLILGATSKIAIETARVASRSGVEFCLGGRNLERVRSVAGDLLARGAKCAKSIECNLGDVNAHEEFWNAVDKQFGDFDCVLLAFGSLGEQPSAEESPIIAVNAMNINFVSAVSLLTTVAKRFEERGSGTIAVISSVAGDRARRSNYVYGTAKSALSFFVEGLKARFHDTGIRVLTIKPGPVLTPMTQHLPNARRFADPVVVGNTIAEEVMRGSLDVLYVPKKWRFIMAVVQSMPLRLMNRFGL